jgi:pyrrolidone-carboxylate peptidase
MNGPTLAQTPKIPTLAQTPSQTGLLQRKCACGGSPGVDGECAECRKKRLSLQRRASSPVSPMPSVPPIVHDVLSTPGQPLDAGTRAFMEPRFGHDFSNVRVHATIPGKAYTKLSVNQPGDQYEQEADQVAAGIMKVQEPHSIEGATASEKTHLRHDFGRVRIHTDAQAAESTRAINALAYTVGNDIVFGAGQYSPWTNTGRSLLAHELTHTIQQGHSHTVSHGKIMRRWDGATECASAPRDKWIEKVVVNQEGTQHVNVHWSDGTVESDECSTGKGHCCVDDATPEGVACSVRESRTDGSNCTPITEAAGYPVQNRVRDHSGVEFWTEFVPGRAIALHDYDPYVDGAPRSHGCVRLHGGTAQKIFCGVRQHRTMVQVHGFARPKCSDTVLQGEWADDFRSATKQPPDGETPRERQKRLSERHEERKMLNAAYGRTLTEAELAGGAGSLGGIPRCHGTAKLPTAEEGLLLPGTPSAARTPTVPVQILAASGFDRFLTPFTNALRSAHNLRNARSVVQEHGRRLWHAATSRAQSSTPDNDDRPLYWARLQMTLALRQWEPSFRLSDVDREDLLTRFEHASRGMETAIFSRERGIKKILISGFDPFDLAGGSLSDISRGNPSGAAVLALNGHRISNGGVTAEVRGVIFPVRFADFDAGIVESFFRPYLSPPQVDMIMTISQGISNAFVVERFAGRRRSAGAPDNLGVSGGGTPNAPVVPSGLGPGAEFIETTLPTATILGTPGGTAPIRENTEVSEIPAGGTSVVHRGSGPTPGSTAVAGSGGGYLSNEIFYRATLLRSQTGTIIPVGHLHTPMLDPSVSGISDPAFVAARNNIVSQIEQILIATLPTL